MRILILCLVFLGVFFQIGCTSTPRQEATPELGIYKNLSAQQLALVDLSLARVGHMHCYGTWNVAIGGGGEEFDGWGSTKKEALEDARSNCMWSKQGTSRQKICKNNAPTDTRCDDSLKCGDSKNIYDLGYPDNGGNKHLFCRSRGYSTYYPPHTSCYVTC